MEILKDEQIKYSLQHGEYSSSFLCDVKKILDSKSRQACPQLNDLFERFCLSLNVAKDDVLGKPKDTIASRQKHLFVALSLKLHSSEYMTEQADKPIKGTLAELVKILQVSPSWLSDMMKNARTYYLIYADFRREVDTLLKKTSEIARKSSEVSL